MSTATFEFDAIVVGSGISGGWAAKELTERGLKVLMLERGRDIPHGIGYENEYKNPWDLPFRGFGDKALMKAEYPVQSNVSQLDEWVMPHFVNDVQNPYQTNPEKPFNWIRGYQLGGRSLTWGRQTYRWGDVDFLSNRRDGEGVDWPIRYADLAPWYDRVEEFIGVSGSKENLPQLPDGKFMKPHQMNRVEVAMREALDSAYPEMRLTVGRTSNITEPRPGRAICQNRSICARGCSFGAYFSTQSSTLPRAQATGNLTLMTNSLVDTLEYDEISGKVSAVNVIHTDDNRRQRYTAKAVFLCAGSVNSVGLLLRSRSTAFPNGMANSSGVLGKYFMDHPSSLAALAVIPGFNQYYYSGNRPTGIVIARFRNLNPQPDADVKFTRGYSFQGGAYRSSWPRGKRVAGIGVDYKNELRKPGPWMFALTAFAESVPRETNQIRLSEKKDAYGIQQLHIEFEHGENERNALEDAAAQARKALSLIGGEVLMSNTEPNRGGMSIHEMGGARMGGDPKTSMLNKYNQAHDVANLFVTDGASMASSACQNPSLTYMALTARAAAYAADQIKSGIL